MDLTWSREIYLKLDLNEEPMDGNDMDDQPTPIVKLPQAHEYAQLLQWSMLQSFQCRHNEHAIFYG